MPAEFESGLFFGEAAWHGLGTVLPQDDPCRFSVRESIHASGLAWSVEKRPCYFLDSDRLPVMVPDKFTVVRDGDIPLGVVGEKWEPLQNEEAFSWFQPWLDTQQVAFETMGALQGGRIVWILATITGESGEADVTIRDGDRVRKYLMLSTSHDGSQSTRVGFTPIRIVCANTLGMAHRSEQSVLMRIRHTKNQNTALETVRETINLMDQEFQATAEQYRILAENGVNEDDLRRYVTCVLKKDKFAKHEELGNILRNQVDEIIGLVEHGAGQTNDGSWWEAYNGVTEFLTHQRGKSDDSRLRSAWFGDSAKTNLFALDLALELAS